MTEASVPSFWVIVPTYNEEDGIREFHRRLATVLRSLPFSSEIVYVNDGSKDGTLEILRSLSAEHDNVLQTHPYVPCLGSTALSRLRKTGLGCESAPAFSLRR